MPIRITRRQSFILGVGLLGAFFAASIAIIISNSSARLPNAAQQLSREAIEGGPSGKRSPTTTTGTVENLLSDQRTPVAGSGFVLNQFHRSLVRDGQTVWEVFGTQGRYDPLGNRAEVDQPRLTVARAGDGAATLTATRAVLSLEGTELTTAELFDAVVVTYKNDTTLRTTRALYDKRADRVTIPVPLTIDNPLVTISGNTLEGELTAQRFTLSSGVHTVIKPRVAP